MSTSLSETTRLHPAAAHPIHADVLVVGAGSAGLAAADAAKRAGLEVRILEKARRVADPWRRRHPQLRLNTHRALSGLPGLAMPAADGAFPGRDTVVCYLEEYAARIDVPIDFGVTVRRVDPLQPGWQLATDQGPYHAEHVVVATGHDRVPYRPDWEGAQSFPGEIRHAADFGEVARYRDKKVLVVGAGNSGTDVLNHLATSATEKVWVAIRHGPVVFPTRLLGVPVQLLSPLLERLPVTLVDRALALTERLAFGDLSRWGMRRHPLGGASRLLRDGTAPAIDNGFVAALKQGRAVIVPAVERFDGEVVRLADGRHLDPDVVICATGYRTGLEPLLGHLQVLNERGVPVTHGAEQDPRYPGLWFTGMRPVLSGFFRAAGVTGKAIAAAIAAQSRPAAERPAWEPEAAARAPETP